MKTKPNDIQEFSAPVKTTLESVPVDVVDRTIRPMDKRIDCQKKRAGNKTLTSYGSFDL